MFSIKSIIALLVSWAWVIFGPCGPSLILRNLYRLGTLFDNASALSIVIAESFSPCIIKKGHSISFNLWVILSLNSNARALLLRDNITHKLKDIECPFLIIHGEKDSAITIDKAEALSKRVPNLYRFLRIKDGPHGPNMTHAQETNNAIIDFMENI